MVNCGSLLKAFLRPSAQCFAFTLPMGYACYREWMTVTTTKNDDDDAAEFGGTISIIGSPVSAYIFALAFLNLHPPSAYISELLGFNFVSCFSVRTVKRARCVSNCFFFQLVIFARISFPWSWWLRTDSISVSMLKYICGIFFLRLQAIKGNSFFYREN